MSETALEAAINVSPTPAAAQGRKQPLVTGRNRLWIQPVLRHHRRIAESTFPFARTTLMTRFLERSEYGRYAVARLIASLNDQHRSVLVTAAVRRMGTFYDTGFNMSSRRQFCSRFVREVIHEATDIQIGEVETFETLLRHNPNPRLAFWRFWYLGRIPWQRFTVTPASLLRSPHLRVIFDAQGDALGTGQPQAKRWAQ